jgi:glutamate synthase domain-containing protein 2
LTSIGNGGRDRNPGSDEGLIVTSVASFRGTTRMPGRALDNMTNPTEITMDTLLLPLSPRFIILTICAVVTVLLLGIGLADGKIFDLVLIPTLIFAGLTALGIRDLTQKSHAVLRNYPISAHIRFLLEEIRPEMRQYFFESEKDGMPFSRDIRAVVYQRAKMDLDKRPFGTQEDVYRDGYEWMHHSMSPKAHAEEKFRVTVGGPDCTKPYSASVFNISAMSFGSLSPNAVRALNAGARKGGFAHDTGEGGVSPYHRENGGDIIWEIGSGYFGCRNRDGSFNPDLFANVASDDPIKMVELKISQGAKPRARRRAAGGQGLGGDLQDQGRRRG